MPGREPHAAMRDVKAEGGWAVVSTEEVEIHPSNDVSPYIEGRLHGLSLAMYFLQSRHNPVVVFDDDHYYLGAVLAEKLRLEGLDITLVTPAGESLRICEP